MTLPLHPITPGGAADGSMDPLLYANREEYGVEAPADPLGEPLGFNRVTAYTRSVESAASVEHFLTGAHNASRIARALIAVEWDGTAYATSADSYLVDTSGTEYRGASVATISSAATGEVSITLAYAMASANLRIHDLTVGYLDPSLAPTSANFSWVEVGLRTITSSTVFAVRRRAGNGAALSGLALADGPFTITIHAG